MSVAVNSAPRIGVHHGLRRLPCFVQRSSFLRSIQRSSVIYEAPAARCEYSKCPPTLAKYIPGAQPYLPYLVRPKNTVDVLPPMCPTHSRPIYPRHHRATDPRNEAVERLMRSTAGGLHGLFFHAQPHGLWQETSVRGPTALTDLVQHSCDVSHRVAACTNRCASPVRIVHKT